jgi:[acyl-carrier-protein] S-malonyltransferase
MQPAADQFRAVLDQVNFTAPVVPVYGNVQAAPVTVDGLREELSVQMTQSVRWTESVQAMIAAGVEVFVELGSGDVLTGLLKRIDRSRSGIAVQQMAHLAQLRELA